MHIEQPKTAGRLRALHLAYLSGLSSWPPPAAALISLIDQHDCERRAWIAVFPADVVKESLFLTALRTSLLWRLALDRGEDGVKQCELHMNTIEALRRSIG